LSLQQVGKTSWQIGIYTWCQTMEDLTYLSSEGRILPNSQNCQVVLSLEAIFCDFNKNPKMSSTFKNYIFCLGRSHHIAGYVLSTAARARVYYYHEVECKLTGSLALYSIRHQSTDSSHWLHKWVSQQISGLPLLYMLPLPLSLENQFSPRNYILHKSWSGISLLFQCITIYNHPFFDSTVSPYCNVIAHLFLYFLHISAFSIYINLTFQFYRSQV